MKKRTKLLAGLLAGIMALGATCFGFAQWSSEISLGGTVSVNGKRELSVTDASIVALSTDAQAEAEKSNTESTFKVQLYPVYADYENVNVNSQQYRYRIDDLNVQETEISASDFETYNASIGVFAFASGSKSGDYTFRLAPNEAGKAINAGQFNRPYVDAADGGTYDGAFIGYAIAWCYQGYSTKTPDNDKVILTYAAAKNYFAENPTVETLTTASFTATEVTYVPVRFSLPGAWAKYTVTITNNGTANANLDDWEVRVSDLDASYTVVTPGIADDEMLAPGESCTLEFIVAADQALTSNKTGSSAFRLTLHYVQDTVEPIPDSGSLLHTHN